jgi:putative transposase
MCKDLIAWRSNPSLKQLNTQSLQVTANRAQLAFQAFFRRAKNGKEPRFPGFGFKAHSDGWRLIEGEKSNHRLRVSGVGIFKICGRGRFSETPKTAELVFKQGKWYASIIIAMPLAQFARAFGNEAALSTEALKSFSLLQGPVEVNLSTVPAF